MRNRTLHAVLVGLIGAVAAGHTATAIAQQEPTRTLKMQSS